MRPPQIILLAILAFTLSGCVRDSFDFKNQLFVRDAFLYNAQIKSVRYIPETGEIIVEGYDGKAQVDAMVKALGAIR